MDDLRARANLRRPALRAVFDLISLQIENLVSEQIAEVSDQDLAVKVRNPSHS